MGLSVIGAGFGRTGTKSLKLALEQMGLGPCHHMEEVLSKPRQLLYWQAAVAGNAVDWDGAFAEYRSSVDWPSAHYWRELAAHYPDAKLVLTVRPEDDWWDSYARTIMPTLSPDRTGITDAHLQGVVNVSIEIIVKKTFGAAFDDRDAGIAAYQRHIAEVKAALPPERLLEFNVGDGWGPLCAFLGLAVPDGPFPRANSSKEFWDDDIRESLKET